MYKHLVSQIEAVVDEEKNITHEQLAQDAEDAFGEPIKLGVKLSADFLEPCYTPIIQSGGDFDLRPSASSNSANLYYGTITCSLGARYKSYCANVGRTYVISPTKGQEKHYKLLLELQLEAINALKPGVPCSDVYTQVLNRLRSKAPQLESHLTKTVGFATGIEFRESSLVLNAKNDTRIRAGMVFNVALGFDKLIDKEATDSRGCSYALFLADTLVVTESGLAEVYTEKAPKAWTEISYSISVDDDSAGASGDHSETRGGVEVLESRTRGAGKGMSAAQETSEALAEHQAELEEQNRVEALQRISKGGGAPSDSSGPVETPVAYRDANHYPTSSAVGGALRCNQTHVDGKQEAVLVPIYGRLVPFHISTIKNVSKNEEGGWTFLRINFIAPGTSTAAQLMPLEAKSGDHYIREITFKAKVATNLNNTFRLIKELRKRVMAREKQKEMEADLVTQASLVPIRTGKVHRLRDVNVRPNVGGKKAPGVIELHTNGLRFQAARGEKLDIIFKNIKLAFFQPAQKEILVLVHFHLHDPIMIGKKKTKDVQFYVEVMEASYALDSTRRSGYDPDELEEEQRERALRNRMNQEFQNFVKKVEEQASNLEFDIPYRELGFYGVPPHNKSTCYIMPAVNALVELTEPPWFCVPLNDIEVAHFERVVYGLKNFDMVLVLKDFNQKPVQVSAINIEHLDALKTWLDNCNIKFYEGPANLNWGSIMKHINGMGLEIFYEEGGWKNVLAMQDSDEEEGEDPDDLESDFEPSGSGSEEEESSEDEYEDEVDSEDEDGSGEESLDSDESEGKGWEEMEQEAIKADKSRGRYEDDERLPSKSKTRRENSASESDDERHAKKGKLSSSLNRNSSKGARSGFFKKV